MAMTPSAPASYTAHGHDPLCTSQPPFRCLLGACLPTEAWRPLPSEGLNTHPPTSYTH